MGPRPFSRGNIVPHVEQSSGTNSLQWGHGLSAVEICSALAGQLYVHMLQWGHGLSAVEIVGLELGFGPEPRASMGPRPFSRGNHDACRAVRSGRHASMGPRPFSRGNRLSFTANWSLLIVASMGPRPFSRGNDLLAAFDIQLQAASMGPRPFSRGNRDRLLAFPQIWSLQWGHGLSAVEISLGRRSPGPQTRFNGATAFQPWKFLTWITESARRSCFNGATAFQPWK